MTTVCAWCDRFLGPDDGTVTHGICGPCTARQHWRDTPVLVVPPHRAGMIPVLRHLLQGTPEIQVVLERRSDDRRQADSRTAPGVERRSGRDRRRRPDLALI